MRASAVAGIVFANINDDLLGKLTSKRSMASVPFGARYRMIDFSLSNLVNAGVTSVGLITNGNYRSLMDHIGSGVYWDLDRKNGGLYLLPPYITNGVRRYKGTIDALMGAMDYIMRSNADYFVLCNADTVANVDISAAIQRHINEKADVTLIYHHGELPANNRETMILDLDENDNIDNIIFDSNRTGEANFVIGNLIISRELLIDLVKEGTENDCLNLGSDVLARKVNSLKMIGFEHKEFVATMSDMKAYYKASMDLLNLTVRKNLYNKNRPIFTKTRDDMPTRYGTKSDVQNCLIADGCVINGTIRNSIVFRGVTVGKGAVVENCILMQGTDIKEDTQLNNVIADKNAVIGENMILKGTKEKCFFVKKNQIL